MLRHIKVGLMRPKQTHCVREKVMTMFDDREKAAEAKWAHDEELRFKIVARRNKLVGLWAAGEMGLPAAESEAYTKNLIEMDITEPGIDDLFKRVKADLAGHKISLSDHTIRRKIDELQNLAGDQLKAG